MKMIPLLFIAFFWYGSTYSQPAQSPVVFNEKLPDLFWTTRFQFLNGDSITEDTLSPYKNRLILLDFWATWCTACVSNFSHLDSLQNQFGDKIKIFLVNSKIKADTKEKMSAKIKRYDKLTSIVFDDYLNQLFPHKYIPHYIWISADGTFSALTTSDFVNQKTIEAKIK